jgi:hypothetical protein
VDQHARKTLLQRLQSLITSGQLANLLADADHLSGSLQTRVLVSFTASFSFVMMVRMMANGSSACPPQHIARLAARHVGRLGIPCLPLSSYWTSDKWYFSLAVNTIDSRNTGYVGAHEA